MRDSYINAMNIQKNTVNWMNAISENLTNLYTPGYRENMTTFKTYLDNAMPDRILKNQGQGKAIPGTSPENVFLEGNGYFVLRNDEHKVNIYLCKLKEDYKFDNYMYILESIPGGIFSPSSAVTKNGDMSNTILIPISPILTFLFLDNIQTLH